MFKGTPLELLDDKLLEKINSGSYNVDDLIVDDDNIDDIKLTDDEKLCHEYFKVVSGKMATEMCYCLNKMIMLCVKLQKIKDFQESLSQKSIIPDVDHIGHLFKTFSDQLIEMTDDETTSDDFVEIMKNDKPLIKKILTIAKQSADYNKKFNTSYGELSAKKQVDAFAETAYDEHKKSYTYKGAPLHVYMAAGVLFANYNSCYLHNIEGLLEFIKEDENRMMIEAIVEGIPFGKFKARRLKKQRALEKKLQEDIVEKVPQIEEKKLSLPERIQKLAKDYTNAYKLFVSSSKKIERMKNPEQKENASKMLATFHKKLFEEGVGSKMLVHDIEQESLAKEVIELQLHALELAQEEELKLVDSKSLRGVKQSQKEERELYEGDLKRTEFFKYDEDGNIRLKDDMLSEENVEIAERTLISGQNIIDRI